MDTIGRSNRSSTTLIVFQQASHVRLPLKLDGRRALKTWRVFSHEGQSRLHKVKTPNWRFVKPQWGLLKLRASRSFSRPTWGWVILCMQGGICLCCLLSLRTMGAERTPRRCVCVPQQNDYLNKVEKWVIAVDWTVWDSLNGSVWFKPWRLHNMSLTQT